MKKLLILPFIIVFGMVVLFGDALASETDWEGLGEGLETGIDGISMVSPTASPVAGTYTSTQSVTLTAEGASSIRYTTNGSTPTCSSTLYSSPISVSSTTTIKAISCYPNSNASGVATFTYTISAGGGGGGGGSSTPRPGDYNTQSGCEAVDFYWYNGSCHSVPETETEDEEEEEETEAEEGTEEYYQGQEEDLEEQLREKETKKNSIENLKGVVLILLGSIEGTDKEEDYKDTLLEILSIIEGLMEEIEGDIEELEELLGIVREKMDLLSQRERAESLENLITILLGAIEDTEKNQAKIAALEAVLDTIRGIKKSIDAKSKSAKK